MNNIAQIRKDSGMTRKDLSEKIGYTETAIYYWETGRRKLPADALLKIAQCMSVEPNALLSPEGGENQ